MKARFSSLVLAVAMIAALAAGVACSRGVSDAQLAGQVQNKISADQGIQSRQITVQTSNGVVTLNGTVNNDTERAAAANDAAQIAGVKTVVNNLQVSAPQTAQAEEPAPPPVEEAPAPRRRSEPRRAAPARHRSASSAPAPAYVPPVSSASNDAAPESAMPAPPPPTPVRRVTVPGGSTLAVRLIDALDSETAQTGQTFHASLSDPVYVGDEVVVPQNADIEGRVVSVKSAGHFAGQSELVLELTRLTINGKTYGLQTSPWSKQGTSRGKRTAATVGGGAALGAIIGGIAGGGKGAAIGSVVGAGAGTGVQGATKGQQINLPSESVLNFQLQNPLTVIPASQMDRGRSGMDQPQSQYNDDTNRPVLSRPSHPQPNRNDDQPPVLQRRPQDQ